MNDNVDEIKCLNCGNNVENNFCSNCGQKTATRRFSLKYILNKGFINSFLMIDKGFFYTLKELLTRPGHSIREYIQGKRVRHFNAFSFLLLLLAIVYFLDEFSSIKLEDMITNSKEFANTIESFIKEYPRLIYVINIPLMAISSYLFFRKSKLNFAENIILNTYNIAAQVVLSLPFAVITIFYQNKTVLPIAFNILTFFSVVYSFWFNYQFFSAYDYKKSSLFFRSLLTVILFSILSGILTVVIFTLKNL